MQAAMKTNIRCIHHPNAIIHEANNVQLDSSYWLNWALCGYIFNRFMKMRYCLYHFTVSQAQPAGIPGELSASLTYCRLTIDHSNDFIHQLFASIASKQTFVL